MSGSPRGREVRLTPVGPLRDGEALLAWLGEALHDELGVRAVAGVPLPERAEWRDPDRGQLNSNRIVDALIELDEPLAADPPGVWRLALTEADLFAPGRDFVFGEAAHGGAWAVVGFARLRAAPDAVEPQALLRRRIAKEAVHELGHLAGLEHCDRPDCVMYASATLADTDRKSASLCPACRAALPAEDGLDRFPARG